MNQETQEEEVMEENTAYDQLGMNPNSQQEGEKHHRQEGAHQHYGLSGQQQF